MESENSLMNLLRDRYLNSRDVRLYEHQEISINALEDGKNILVSVPTASGKSLIAYYGILKTLERGYRAVYCCPLKSLSREKYEELLKLCGDRYKVSISTGDLSVKDEHLRNSQVIVMTNEKADSIIHNDPDFFINVGIVVFDEIHNLGDPERGPIIEMLVSAIRVINPEVQIVGLSATIKNSQEIGEWLNAQVVKTNFRPVPLEKFIIHRGWILDKNENRVEKAGYDIYEVVKKTVQDSGQVLLFLNTRKRAEKFAFELIVSMKEIIGSKFEDFSIDQTDRYHEMLSEILPYRVSFHHAGLSSAAKNLIEDEFKYGNIKVLTATPTLAAGVNLPARAVIIRDLTRFSQGYTNYISNMEIEQMLGRAGRPKYDKKGYAYIYCPTESSLERVREFYKNGVEPIDSKFGNERKVRFNTLALIANGLCTDVDSLRRFFSDSLYAKQKGTEIIIDVMEKSIENLKNEGFAEEKNGVLKPTELGRLTASLYIDPETANIIIEEFENNYNLEDFLYCVCKTPDVDRLYLNNKDYDTIEDFISKLREEPETEEEYMSAKTAALIYDWINEVPIGDICEKYNVGPGDIEGKKSTVEWVVGSASRLSTRYKRELYETLSKLAIRISEGVKEEVISLLTVEGIGRVRARRLYESGYTDLKKISEATIDQISSIYGFSRTLAGKVIEDAKKKVKII